MEMFLWEDERGVMMLPMGILLLQLTYQLID